MIKMFADDIRLVCSNCHYFSITDKKVYCPHCHTMLKNVTSTKTKFTNRYRFHKYTIDATVKMNFPKSKKPNHKKQKTKS